MLVDSCIDPNSKTPASGAYLDQIGVDSNQVHTIVASHWHDDHVRGISQLAAKHSNANFVFSTVFNAKEASIFLAAYSGASSTGLVRGSKELFTVIKERDVCSPAHHKSIVLETTLNGRSVRVTALSPVPAAYARSLADIAQYVPRKGDPINHAPELRPNLEAIVLHIDLDDDALLLGADLEDHDKLGWSVVTADPWSSTRRPASAYKVAHHGSHTGDCPQIWQVLLKPSPVACLTPFSLGRHRLPTDADKERLRGNTPHAYITSGASRRPDMDSRQLKRLGDVCKKLALIDAGFGAVRLRKQLGAPLWNIELFGAAQPL